MHVNEVVLLGELTRPVEIVYGDTGQPTAKGTLCVREESQGKVYTTYVPLEVLGRAAETLGEAAAGQQVLVRGRLGFRKRGSSEKGELLIVSWSVHCAPAAVPARTN